MRTTSALWGVLTQARSRVSRTSLGSEIRRLQQGDQAFEQGLQLLDRALLATGHLDQDLVERRQAALSLGVQAAHVLADGLGQADPVGQALRRFLQVDGADIGGGGLQAVGALEQRGDIVRRTPGGDPPRQFGLLHAEIADQLFIEFGAAAQQAQRRLGFEHRTGTRPRQHADLLDLHDLFHRLALGPLQLLEIGPGGDDAEQFGGIERLDQMIVHAGIQAALAIARQAVGGHGDDRQPGQRRSGTQFAGGRQAVQAWHMDVHQHQVVALLFQLVQRGLAVFGHVDQDAAALQEADDHLAVDGVVVHQQQADAL